MMSFPLVWSLKFPLLLVAVIEPSSSSAFFSEKMAWLASSITWTIRRRSCKGFMGSQSTNLFRQYNETLRTKKGINGRRKISLSEAGLCLGENRPTRNLVHLLTRGV